MRLGCCGDLNAAPVIQTIGFDYVEPSVVALDPGGSDSAFRRYAAAFEKLDIRPESFNGFLPPTLRVTGPQVDRDALDRYVSSAFERVAALGGAIVVFGSGPARSVPDGFDRDRAEQQLVDFLSRAGDRADPYEVTLALEPLRTEESNILNTVAEATDVARRVNHPRITVLADLYHMMQESEPLDHVGLPDRLTHVHLSDLRRRPPGSDGYDFEAFALALRQVEYTARVSLECVWSDLAAEGPPALARIRQAFAAP